MGRAKDATHRTEDRWGDRDEQCPRGANNAAGRSRRQRRERIRSGLVTLPSHLRVDFSDQAQHLVEYCHTSPANGSLGASISTTKGDLARDSPPLTRLEAAASSTPGRASLNLPWDARRTRGASSGVDTASFRMSRVSHGMGTADRRQLFLPLNDNYFCRSSTRVEGPHVQREGAGNGRSQERGARIAIVVVRPRWAAGRCSCRRSFWLSSWRPPFGSWAHRVQG
jgi:hypothetical protein